MTISFDQLKMLVTLVGEDLLKGDLDKLLDLDDFPDGVCNQDSGSIVSFEVYDKILLLYALLAELYKHRPLPF